MTKKYILTGGPGVGKSTIINLAQNKALCSIEEAATYIIKLELEKPENEQIVPWKNPYEFQRNVFSLQKKLEDEIPRGIEKALIDRGIIDNLAYLRLNNLQETELYKEVEEEARKRRYEKIFLLEPLPAIEKTEVRRDCDLAAKIHELIQEEYTKQGYKTEKIPALPREERTEFILKLIR